MAKAKKESTVEFNNIIWCIDNLDTKQIEIHDKKPRNADQCFEGSLEMIEKGFKIGMKWDSYSSSHMVYATNQDANSDNAGLAISARGDDLLDAMSILLFKFFDVAKGDLRPFADKMPKGVRG